jgi:hypothetical protein
MFDPPLISIIGANRQPAENSGNPTIHGASNLGTDVKSE